MQAKAMGAPLSNRTIHQIMKKKQVTTTDYDEEVAEAEDDLDTELGTLGREGDSDGPVDDDSQNSAE